MINQLLNKKRHAVDLAREREHVGRVSLQHAFKSFREEGERQLVKPATLAGLFTFGFVSDRSFGSVARARTETLLAGVGYTALVEVGSQWLSALQQEKTEVDAAEEDCA